MTHIFRLEANFTNGATGVLTTPNIHWCDLDSWAYYMGIHQYCVCAVDDKYHEEKWESTHFVEETAGRFVLEIDRTFFLCDLAKVWRVQIRK